MRRVLVAVDGSSVQEQVLATALQLVRGMEGKLLLFRAVPLPMELPSEALLVPPSDVPQILLKRAQAQLEALAQTIPPQFREGVRAELGTPWRAVVDAAKRERADVIVIGSHGYGGLDRLLGTTAAKIVDHADCSVLVSRPPR